MGEKTTIPAIEAENINFQYNDSIVVENVNFSIAPGEYWGLIGPNGGGKTTLLKLILGLIEPSFGQIRIFGKPVEKMANRALIGYVPQKISEAQNFPATVEEVVRTGRTPRIGMIKRFENADHRAVKKALEIAGIAKYKDALIGDLSGGQRQRAFIARALASEPKVLILDEPTVGVDLPAQAKFYTFIADLNKTHGLTILFASHDIDVISKEVGAILCLNRTLVYHGPPHGFIDQEDQLHRLYGRKVTFVSHPH